MLYCFTTKISSLLLHVDKMDKSQVIVLSEKSELLKAYIRRPFIQSSKPGNVKRVVGVYIEEQDNDEHNTQNSN